MTTLQGSDRDFLAQLREVYPYLYDVEMLVREIQTKTGFGEVSINLRVTKGKVDKSSSYISHEKLYRIRKENELT